MKTAGSPDEEKDAGNLEQVPTVEADGTRGKLEPLREKAEEIVARALAAFEASGRAAAAESVFGSEENKETLTAFRREYQGPWAVMCANLQGVVDLNELRRFTRVDKRLHLAGEDDSLSYIPSILENEFGYFVQRMTLEGPVPEQVTDIPHMLPPTPTFYQKFCLSYTVDWNLWHARRPTSPRHPQTL